MTATTWAWRCSYQDYLVEQGMLHEQLDPSDDIGIRLEFLGAEKEKILFWHRSIPVTTLAQLSDILGQLDINNPDVVYYGWQPGGANSMYPAALTLDRVVGTQGPTRRPRRARSRRRTGASTSIWTRRRRCGM